MIRLFFLVLGFGSCVFCNAQKIIINGKEGKRKLVWADFTGKPDKSDPYFAYTHWNINQKLDNIRFIGDSVSIGSFLVTLELDPVKSWAKKDHLSDDLLRHEQGHFDIGILCLNEILKRYHDTKLTKSNWNSAIQKIVSDMMQKYDAMMTQYDRETEHSNIKEEQKRWNKFFEDQLEKNKTKD